MSRSNELVEKAVALTKLYKEVQALAEENNYNVEMDSTDGTLHFDDWLSSSCYGEGDDGFGTSPDGSIWYSSSC